MQKDKQLTKGQNCHNKNNYYLNKKNVCNRNTWKIMRDKGPKIKGLQFTFLGQDQSWSGQSGKYLTTAL